MAEQETYLGAWVERLQEEVAILEARAEHDRSALMICRQRAEAAEARAERLQGALEEIAGFEDGNRGFDEMGYREAARAALGQEDAALSGPPRGTYGNPRSNPCTHGRTYGCEICDKRAYASAESSKPCPECKGIGRVRPGKPCPTCKGSGLSESGEA